MARTAVLAFLQYLKLRPVELYAVLLFLLLLFVLLLPPLMQ